MGGECKVIVVKFRKMAVIRHDLPSVAKVKDEVQPGKLRGIGLVGPIVH